MLGMDGVPHISRLPIAPGQEFLYDLPGLLPGSYWFHPHGHETQLDVGLAGVLIVDPADPGRDPAYDREHVVVLDDWNDRLGGGYVGHVLNGRTSTGQLPLVVQQGERVRLRLLNAAAVTNYVIALDGHPLTVTHADGNRVQPVTVAAIPIGIGERYDAIIECTNPGVWSLATADIRARGVTLVRGVVQYTGQTQPPPPPGYVPPNLAAGSLLSYGQLAAYFPVPPITPTPDRVFTASLGMAMGQGGMVHTINGQTWPDVTPLVVAPGDQVQMAIVNTAMMMMAEHHPMHVHGHFFRLMNTAGGMARPPLKDTVLIRRTGQAGSSASVQILMDNPGRWLFHCHNMEHMATGMMTAIEYTGDSDGDAIPNRLDHDPRSPAPVAMIPDDAVRFRPGGGGEVGVQWTSGSATALFVGIGELNTPIPFPPYGMLALDPAQALLVGTTIANAAHRASFPYAIPGDQALVGLRLGFQAFGALALPGGFRLGPFQAMTVR
jgi:FtsP/CotA-like multicopper oxidase with cupredoxin domain